MCTLTLASHVLHLEQYQIRRASPASRMLLSQFCFVDMLLSRGVPNAELERAVSVQDNAHDFLHNFAGIAYRTSTLADVVMSRERISGRWCREPMYLSQLGGTLSISGSFSLCSRLYKH